MKLLISILFLGLVSCASKNREVASIEVAPICKIQVIQWLDSSLDNEYVDKFSDDVCVDNASASAVSPCLSYVWKWLAPDLNRTIKDEIVKSACQGLKIKPITFSCLDHVYDTIFIEEKDPVVRGAMAAMYCNDRSFVLEKEKTHLKSIRAKDQKNYNEKVSSSRKSSNRNYTNNHDGYDEFLREIGVHPVRRQVIKLLRER